MRNHGRGFMQTLPSWVRTRTAQSALRGKSPMNTSKHKTPLAAQLLQWWAYFDNEDIWFELLQPPDDDYGGLPWLQELTDELNFNRSMGILHNYGFVEPHSLGLDDAGSRGYSIHSCLHSWTVHVLNHDWDNDLGKLALRCVASHVPSKNDSQFWVLQRRLLLHAMKSCGGKIDVSDANLAWAFHKFGNLYSDQGKLQKAEQMFSLALRGKEKQWGPDHTSTLDTVNNLGNLYKTQGRLQEAEEMYLRALKGKEKVRGPDHTSTLNTVNNLGLLYTDQGKLHKAEEMYLWALRGYEKAWGQDHTSTLRTVNNLGVLYKTQGQLQKAEDMCLRALKGKEKALGPDHTSTLSTVNNLGILYKAQGHLQKAEAMYLRVLEGYEKGVSPETLVTFRPAINATWNLGIVSLAQSKLVEGRKLCTQALTRLEKLEGFSHPDVSSWHEFVTDLNKVSPGSLAIGPITRASPAGEGEGGIIPTSASKKKRRDALKAVFRRFNK